MVNILKRGGELKYYISVVLIILCFGIYFVAVSADEKDGVELPIVMYHSILKDEARIGKYVVSPKSFEQDLIFLKDNGFETVNFSDLTAYVYKGKKLPEKPVMITFDDGYYNNLVYAGPLLEKYNMKAVISVIGTYSDEFSKTGERNANYSHLVWDDVKMISESGVFEVQNHSYDLHTISRRRSGSMKNSWESVKDYRDIFMSDTKRCQDILDSIGIKKQCYTYPFGMYCGEAERCIREMGFIASLSCTEGMNYITKDKECLYLLKRYNRPGGADTVSFFKKVLK